LLNVRKRIKENGGSIGKIYGQEKNITTYNLARMNMLLHGMKDTEFEIFHGDTLENQLVIAQRNESIKKIEFDAIVAIRLLVYVGNQTIHWQKIFVSKVMV
jgi:type I restriction enzyme M protein